jgi:hypothetical protein
MTTNWRKKIVDLVDAFEKFHDVDTKSAQDMLADRLDISRSTMYRWIKGTGCKRPYKWKEILALETEYKAKVKI